MPSGVPAEENELAIYKWMRDVQGLCAADIELDTRLERQARGTLKATIVTNERENREQKQ
ncbi:MAG TPA: hypothetical protein VG168_16155 [Bryobacteraceae bacterium]|nr:hypothetical protein [Bryobacteraceae bacterium]